MGIYDIASKKNGARSEFWEAGLQTMWEARSQDGRWQLDKQGEPDGNDHSRPYDF